MILGASRGLGAALVRHAGLANARATGWARKADRMKRLSAMVPNFGFRVGDLAREADQASAIADAVSAGYDRIFVVLGGGPWGPYHAHEFRSHAWAFEVNFLFPAKLLHALARAGRFPPVVLTGSAVAEAAADPFAASYGAAKHALRGLYLNLRAEYPNWDVRLFSPGYLDTELLPAKAPPRLKGVYDVQTIAAELWTWAHRPDIGGHRVYPPHPVC